jgi:vacuolar-type H+-ATPase subunit H
MSAFNEVMAVEQEAEQAIVTAKEGVVAALHAAEADRRARLTAVENELKTQEQTELAKHAAEVLDTARKIKSDADAEVVAITQRFVARKDELIAYLTGRFQ